MILIDTGNNIRADHVQATLATTEQLVIPATLATDSLRTALALTTTLETMGHRDLVSRAVVLVHDLDDLAPRAQITALINQLADVANAIVPIPYHAALKDGDEIDRRGLAPWALAAYQEAAVTLTTALISSKGTR